MPTASRGGWGPPALQIGMQEGSHRLGEISGNKRLTVGEEFGDGVQ
ncbi:hypothetical protein [Acidithiobacillus sp.]|nr:hypothetical protein [Acidithiobacillus sp.]